MKLKIKEYLAENMKDLITRCNFISRVFRWLIFGSLSIFILEIILATNITENHKEIPVWLDPILAIIAIVPIYTLIYSSKTFLFTIPLIWLIQCWDCVKNRKVNMYVVSNLCLWLLIVFISIMEAVFGYHEEECMEKCVLPDNSNYVECANSTCDFPI